MKTYLTTFSLIWGHSPFLQKAAWEKGKGLELGDRKSVVYSQVFYVFGKHVTLNSQFSSPSVKRRPSVSSPIKKGGWENRYQYSP